MAAIPDDLKDLLDKAALAHVATVTPKGAPRTSPMWFEWDGPGDDRVIFRVTPERVVPRGG